MKKPREGEVVVHRPGSTWPTEQLLRAFELLGRDHRHVSALVGLAADVGVLLEEMRNDGSWVRQWRRAAIEYAK
ncbi:MAG: hypothetical protein V1907_03785 [Candidatus Kerfeldbacteria bacterium]